ncbi:hypothetical protein EG327_006326 [Venturia inaequalis]|uniref:Zn(2)-C6 fungal-type domain-containing protein n=2 Tax=Venturia inaequalis TaxID=5025 RepID=A0A8H3ZH45_VENIN|nr:hypothetical protein EG327_006326 [Venturia inaequalis]
MASGCVYGPALPSPTHRMSISTSPGSSASSSESPRTTFDFSVRYMNRNDTPPSPTGEDVLPKVEEVEEDEAIDAKIKSPSDEGEPAEPSALNGSGSIARRPRGRPRKHPKSPMTAITKPPKGRSKTGCITCRRRKKKCDEKKPECDCCRKNNVHCEGYPPKDYWQSGKQRVIKGRKFSIDKPLPYMIQGIENDTDWFFFEHFNRHLSCVLSLYTERNNPFKELLLPMAVTHKGLMHSILCLSGSHLIAKEPNEDFEQRQFYHFDRALNDLSSSMSPAKTTKGDEASVIDDPTVAQVLVLCLKSICAGEVQGEYRMHLDAAKHLIKTQPSANPDFQSFLVEFFVYHDVSNSITSIDRPSILTSTDFQLPNFVIPDAAMFLGVADGLFLSLSNIRELRDKVRVRKVGGQKPVVDYTILAEAAEIDHSLRQWECHQAPDTPRSTSAYLYRQCTWLYLQRTIKPSRPSEEFDEGVALGLEYLKYLPEDSSCMSIMLMPIFLLGICAFSKEHRPDIEKAFDNLQSYSSLGNIAPAKKVVQRIWEMMDSGDEESWYFEKVQHDMGLDFLVT